MKKKVSFIKKSLQQQQQQQQLLLFSFVARGAVQGVVRPVDGLTKLRAVAKHLRITRAKAQLVGEGDFADAAKEFEVALTIFAVRVLIFLETIARAIARLVAHLARFEFLGRNFLAVSAPVLDA